MNGAPRPSLADWQRDLVACALHDDPAATKRLLPGLAIGPVPVGDALRIHAAAVHQGLQAALGQRVPTVKALVGDAFFAELVRGHARQHPPRQPQLAVWGGQLPEFIRGHAACQGLPYLADAAAFDLALDAVALATPGEWLAPLRLAPDLEVRLLSSLLVFSAGYAVDDLRDAVTSAVAGDAAALESWPTTPANRRYALWCAADSRVHCVPVTAGVAAFLLALQGSAPAVPAPAGSVPDPADQPADEVVEEALRAVLATTGACETDPAVLFTALLRELANLGGVQLSATATND